MLCVAIIGNSHTEKFTTLSLLFRQELFFSLFILHFKTTLKISRDNLQNIKRHISEMHFKILRYKKTNIIIFIKNKIFK